MRSVCWILSHFVANLNVLMVHLYLFVVTFSFAIVLFVIFFLFLHLDVVFRSLCLCVSLFGHFMSLCVNLVCLSGSFVIYAYPTFWPLEDATPSIVKSVLWPELGEAAVTHSADDSRQWDAVALSGCADCIISSTGVINTQNASLHQQLESPQQHSRGCNDP